MATPGFLGKTITWVFSNWKNISSGVGEQITTRNGFIIFKRPPNRDAVDIGDFKDALKMAENSIQPKRYKLYNIYEQIQLDDDYKTGTRKRKSSLNNLELVYMINENPENDITEWLKNPVWRKFKNDILDTIFWGHSLFEFYFDDKENFYFLIPRKNVEPRKGQVLRNETDFEGILYRDFLDNGLTELFSDDGEFGLLLAITRPYILKYNSDGDWASYCELAGQNFMALKTEYQGTKDLNDFEKALNNRGAGGVFNVPDGVNLSTTNTSSASQNQLFKEFDRNHSNKILKLILGQSTTSNDDEQGSFAKSAISLFEQTQIHIDDRSYVLNYLNYTFKKLLPKFGFSDQGNFEFQIDEDIEPEEKEIKTKEEVEEEIEE